MSYYERHLPHWQPDGKSLFITWRLDGSLPDQVVQTSRAKHGKDAGRFFRDVDRILDRGEKGPLWLRDPLIAQYVVESLKQGQALEHYSLWAYVVMANHVHILIDPKVPLQRLTKAIKGSTARKANQLLGHTGSPFWQDESFDHWVRSGREFERIWFYIENNPVKAGLVATAEKWNWSSAQGRTGTLACPPLEAVRPQEI